MRVFSQLQSPKESVIRVLLEFETWSEWVPKLDISSVSKSSEEQAIIDWSSASGPMTIQQKMEVTHSSENIFKFKQIKGSFPIKDNSMEWTLLPPQKGAGVTLRIDAEVELPMFIPKAMVYGEMRGHLAKWARALDLRARSVMAPEEAKVLEEAEVSEEAEDIPTEPKKILQVYQTKKGLEMWLLGKRYMIKLMQ